MEIPAMPTPIPHSLLRLNQRGGRGSKLVDFPQEAMAVTSLQRFSGEPEVGEDVSGILDSLPW